MLVSTKQRTVIELLPRGQRPSAGMPARVLEPRIERSPLIVVSHAQIRHCLADETGETDPALGGANARPRRCLLIHRDRYVFHDTKPVSHEYRESRSSCQPVGGSAAPFGATKPLASIAR